MCICTVKLFLIFFFYAKFSKVRFRIRGSNDLMWSSCGTHPPRPAGGLRTGRKVPCFISSADSPELCLSNDTHSEPRSVKAAEIDLVSRSLLIVGQRPGRPYCT